MDGKYSYRVGLGRPRGLREAVLRLMVGSLATVERRAGGLRLAMVGSMVEGAGLDSRQRA